MHKRLQLVTTCVGGGVTVFGVLALITPNPAQTQESKPGTPEVVLADTYNAVTKIHFTNVAVHKGSPNPNPAKRRFRVDLKYWLMDAKYYDKGVLSIGNPELTEFVRTMGKKNLPASEPTTLSAMAYEIANGVLEKYAIVQKVEVRLTHFSKGEEPKDEAEDNHVVNIVVRRKPK
jgi:hypothetical protein